MKRTLIRGQVIVSLNELQYVGTISKAVITQAPNFIEKMELTIDIDEVATVDEDGNVLTVNKNAHGWKEWADMQLEEEALLDT